MYPVQQSRALMRVTICVFFHLFSPEKSLRPGSPVCAVWPRGDALGCGCWIPKPRQKRCSCIDSSGGMGAGCFTSAATASSLLMLQPMPSWLLLINCALFIRLVFLCVWRRTDYSAGMLFGVSTGFSVP